MHQIKKAHFHVFFIYFYEEMFTSSLPIIEEFLRSVVVLTVSTGYQKDAGLPFRVEINFPDPTIYLPASGCQSTANFLHWLDVDRLTDPLTFILPMYYFNLCKIWGNLEKRPLYGGPNSHHYISTVALCPVQETPDQTVY